MTLEWPGPRSQIYVPNIVKTQSLQNDCLQLLVLAESNKFTLDRQTKY